MVLPKNGVLMGMTMRCAFLIFFVFISSCSWGENLSQADSPVSIPSDTPNPSDTSEDNNDIPSPTTTQNAEILATDLNFSPPQLTIQKNTRIQLLFNLSYSNGDHDDDLAVSQIEARINCDILLTVSPTSIATISNTGLFTPLQTGTATVHANCHDLQASLSIRITSSQNTSPLTDPGPSSETPLPDDENTNGETDETPENQNPETPTSSIPDDLDDEDSFLNNSDSFQITIGANGGYGLNTSSAERYALLYGPPVSSLTDVISLGHSGYITITLNQVEIVDGDGADFVVFENPFSSTYGAWTERAVITVSEDGIHWHSFSCDAFDEEQIYAGCAGVTPANYSADTAVFLDPTTSGGDLFDLAELGLSRARYLRITDAGTCAASALCTGNTRGFDLDAIGIFNGRYLE